MYQHSDIKNLFRVYINREHLKLSFPTAAVEEKLSKEELANDILKAEEELEKLLERRDEARLVYREYKAATPNKVLLEQALTKKQKRKQYDLRIDVLRVSYKEWTRA